ncbi:GlxA family transcriptional regulator [Streptomyces flavofungini]|uniref:GlxA family transcriptional regulator n=1 Tax=Streptomyces flavofungini TaxID=68200 RepID=UPI0035580DD2
MRTRSVLFVLCDGVALLDVAGPMDVFTGANAWAAHRSAGPAPYAVTTASCGGAPVRTSCGMTAVPDADLDAVGAPHTLFVPGLEAGPQGEFVRPDVVAWLRRQATQSDRIVSVCTGAFQLAGAGLLSGHRVTTHWSAAQKLAREYPQVEVDPDPIFIRDGKVSTSGGVTSGIDLALALIEEDLGREASLVVARHLVVFLRRPGDQRQFSTQLRAQVAHRSSLRDVQQWIADHPDADLSVTALAQRASLSPRQFNRAFTAETGMPPGRYVEQARLETARRLLEDDRDSIDQVAQSSGFTPEALRRAFHRNLGLSPTKYRDRF